MTDQQAEIGISAAGSTGSPPSSVWRRHGRLMVLAALLLVFIAILAGRTYYRASASHRFEQALAALEARDVATVERLLAELQGVQGFDSRRAYLRGALSLRRGDMTEAIEDLNLAARDPLLHSRALILIGEGMYRVGEAGEAHRAWTTALRHDPDAVDAHRWLGVLYYDLGAMQDAVNHLQLVADMDPRDARPHRLLGLIKKDYERFDDAVRHYQDALTRDPNLPGLNDVLFELSESQVKLRDYPAALETLQRCPPTPLRMALEGECLHSLGRTDEALARIEQALAMEGDRQPAWLLQGTILLEGGQAEGAIQAFRQVVQQRPKDYQARYKLVQALRRGGHASEADEQAAVADELRKRWDRFSELHTKAITEPRNAELRFELGQLAEQLERPDLAGNWYRAALALNPQHLAARQRLEHLGL